jgi:hypothetical protein
VRWHYRKRGLCRAFKFLPCVFYRAHGKELLCRAFLTHGKESLPCVLFYGARQKIFAVRFKYRRTAKIFFFLHSLQQTAVSLWRALLGNIEYKIMSLQWRNKKKCKNQNF